MQGFLDGNGATIAAVIGVTAFGFFLVQNRRRHEKAELALLEQKDELDAQNRHKDTMVYLMSCDTTLNEIRILLWAILALGFVVVGKML